MYIKHIDCVWIMFVTCPIGFMSTFFTQCKSLELLLRFCCVTTSIISTGFVYGGAIITRHKQPKVAILHPSSQAGAFYGTSCTQHTARMCFLVLSRSISSPSRHSVLARPVLWPLVSTNFGLNCSVLIIKTHSLNHTVL